MTVHSPQLLDCLYWGPVTHRRYRPVRHALRYSVFSIFADIDQLENLKNFSPLIGYNTRRFLTIRDQDHGPGDGTPISQHVWGLVHGHDGLSLGVERVFMLCFPRILGRLFNPLTVYVAVNAGSRPVLMIYEVSNTFGQRHSYVVPVSKDGAQTATKQFYVSPFNEVAGEYRFRLHRLGESLRLDIVHFVGDGLLLSARVEGERRPLSTTQLTAAAFALAVQPLKVWGGIHWEAFRLYLKGLRPKERPEHPRFDVSPAHDLPKRKPAVSKSFVRQSHIKVHPQSIVRTP